MMRLIAFAVFAFRHHSVSTGNASCAVHEPDGILTQIADGCGAGRTRVGGVCVARTTKRLVRVCAMEWRRFTGWRYY